MKPIETVDLFLPLQHELTSLLRGLAPEDWQRPTVAGAWRVKDIVAHLLDSDMRRLSLNRDGHIPPPPSTPIDNYGGLVAFLNDLNSTWVTATARLSPRVLTELLDWAGPQVADYFASLPPRGEAFFPVAWAGEEKSENWMDIGREYTEKWHHQAQIRAAVGAPGLMERKWLYPFFAISVCALPHAFRDQTAATGTILSFSITGDAGGNWFLQRAEDRWLLGEGESPSAHASIRLDADVAWRLFYNALDRETARASIEAVGDEELIAQFISTRSVMV
jgi:uncharacterized protein (TIGR03083 family)